MNVWCVDTSDKIESIRTLFLATIRAVYASGGILYACRPDIIDNKEDSKKLKLICIAGTETERFTDENNLLESIRGVAIPEESVYILENSQIGKTILILCRHLDSKFQGEIYGILLLYDAKGNDQVLHSLGTSIGTLCVGVIPSDSLADCKVSDSGKSHNIDSVHGMVMEAQRLYEKSKAANRKQDMFLANMSHELRGPLHNIIGMTRLLEDSENLSPQQREYLDVIDHSGVQLLNIIGDILDYSKLVAGELPLRPSNFSPQKLVEESIDVILYRGREKGLDITHSILRNVPHALFGDAKRIQQILVNLLNNSVKFTEMGKVHVLMDAEERSEVIVEDGSKYITLHVSVEDTGIGIPRRYHQTVFKTFTQVDQRRSKLTEGSGLGLAIVKKLISMMEGRITLFSRSTEDGYEPDKTGTEMHFYIPLRVPVMLDDNKGKSSSSEINIKKLLKRKYVLLYDEEVNSRVHITSILIGWGALVLSCATSHEVAMYLNTQTIAIRLSIIYCNTSTDDNKSEPYQLISLIEEAIGPCPIIEMYSDPKMCTLESNGLCKPIKKTALRLVIQNCLSAKKCNPTSPYFLRSHIVSDEKSSTNGSSSDSISSSKESTNKKRLIQRLRVLVVEDNAASRLVAIGYLKKIDHTIIIHVATNGQEAIDKVIRSSGTFDLILMDIRMPGLNGIEATKKIRSIVKRDIYIVAFTATIIEHEIEKNIDGETHMNYFDALIGKPVMIEELESVVRLVQKRKLSHSS